MPKCGEIWIKTNNGWRTTKTIVIVNKRRPTFHTEANKTNVKRNSCGVYWKSTSPFVVLPGETKTSAVYYFVSKENQMENNASVTSIFQTLQFQQGLKDDRKFNYITKLIETALKQELLSRKNQKYALKLLESLVQHVLSTERNVHIAKKLLTIYKKKHLAGRGGFENKRCWSSINTQIYTLETKLNNFTVKKLCRTRLNAIQLLDLPVEAIRLILHCLNNHKDVYNVSMVCSTFNKLCREQGLWKGLCQYQLPPLKIKNVDTNIPNSWRDTYKACIKRSSIRKSYCETLVICSHCNFVWWKFSSHQCTYVAKGDDTTKKDDTKKDGEEKPPIFIPISPKGFFHLFDEQ